MSNQNIIDDIERFAMIQYNIGYITMKPDDDVIEELSDMISDYVTELFIAKRNDGIEPTEDVISVETYEAEVNRLKDEISRLKMVISRMP